MEELKFLEEQQVAPELIKRVEELELQRELNKDDYNYLEIILEKTKVNLQKSYMLLKL